MLLGIERILEIIKGHILIPLTILVSGKTLLNRGFVVLAQIVVSELRLFILLPSHLLHDLHLFVSISRSFFLDQSDDLRLELVQFLLKLKRFVTQLGKHRSELVELLCE
jgi:hypothetical protein